MVTNKTINIKRNRWEKTTLGSVVEIIGGGTPKTTIDEYWNGDIPWLSVVDFNNDDRWVRSTEKHITEEGLNNSSTKLLDAGDIVISARGTVGALTQLKRPMAFNQSCYGLRARKDISGNDFLYYLIKYSLKQISSNVHGAVFDTITRETFDNIAILLPSLSEQRAIASVLSSLDDKIELLREQNKTLEAIAQTVFKEWFVNFNFSDENGKPYKDSGGRMVDSELGEIPEGWSVGTLGDVVELRGGSTPSTKNSDYWGGDICWTSPKDLSGSSDIYLTNTEKRITDEGLTRISSGLLPKGTLLLSSRAPVGYLAISDIEVSINQGYIALLDDASFPSRFMYLWLKKFMDRVTNAANGSTFLEVSKTAFKLIDTVIPNNTTIQQFLVTVNGIFEKILANQFQIQTLISLRDTLLPELMSGDVRVNYNKRSNDET